MRKIAPIVIAIPLGQGRQRRTAAITGELINRGNLVCRQGFYRRVGWYPSYKNGRQVLSNILAVSAAFYRRYVRHGDLSELRAQGLLDVVPIEVVSR